MEREYRHRQPSLFFPIALITAGVIWLLVNSGAIQAENMLRLLPFWPVLLIMAGVSLLFRRMWWPLNALMWGAAAVLVIWLLTAGSAFLPKLPASELKHETLRAEVGQAKSAAVNLDLSVYSATVRAQAGASDLIVADVYSFNGMLLDASGGERKNIQLRSIPGPNNAFFNPPIGTWLDSAQRTWDIALTDKIPLDLMVDIGTGSARLDLQGLKLEGLKIDGGTGSANIVLPAGSANLPLTIDVGTGSFTMQFPANTPVDMRMDGGTGSLNITLPAGAGVQVEVRDGGTGSLNLPEGFTKVRGEAGEDEGVWENAAFKTSKTPIKMNLDIGTGSVNID